MIAPAIGVPVSAAIEMVKKAMPILSPDGSAVNKAQHDSLYCEDHSPISFMFFVKPAIQAGTVETREQSSACQYIPSLDRGGYGHSEHTICSREEAKQNQEHDGPTAIPKKKGSSIIRLAPPR
jgi:hypothetical protein